MLDPNRPAAELYLDLLVDCLGDSLRPEEYVALAPGPGGPVQLAKRAAVSAANGLLSLGRLELVRQARVDPAMRREGLDWPARAETLLGRKCLEQLRSCVRTVLDENIPGDLIECGVWRGGATILMRALLAVHGDRTRRVWVADSFQGLPAPDAARYPADRGDLAMKVMGRAGGP